MIHLIDISRKLDDPDFSMEDVAQKLDEAADICKEKDYLATEQWLRQIAKQMREPIEIKKLNIIS